MAAQTGSTPETDGRPGKKLSTVNVTVPALLAVVGSLATQSKALAGIALVGAIVVAVTGIATQTLLDYLKEVRK